MTAAPWLHVVGIGEDGVDGLSPAARALLDTAEVVLGGDRHHRLTPGCRAERLSWPSPFPETIDLIRSQKGRRFVLLATGDPLWYSIGARVLKEIPGDEVAFHPQLSAFQWAACRMRWSLADLETVTAHGRAPESVIPFLAPGARLLALSSGPETPQAIGRLLVDGGYGSSRMSVLANLGGVREERLDGDAADWAERSPERTPPFHVMAIDCRLNDGVAFLSRAPGLPDAAFQHDGKMTKREVRAATLAKLGPARGALLWDIGVGCGSVAIEWMRAARDADAIGVDPNSSRRAIAASNALALGAPRLKLIDGEAPAALADLPGPDAVFLGGGLSEASIEYCREALKPHGRLVANAVTLESEAILLAAYARYGGELTRLAIARAEPVGPFHGWRTMMPVTQWSLAQ